MNTLTPTTSAPTRLQEIDRGGGSPPGGDDIVDDQDLFAGLDRIDVHLEGVGPVLEAVGLGDGLGRQLAGLPEGDEAGS